MSDQQQELLVGLRRLADASSAAAASMQLVSRLAADAHHEIRAWRGLRYARLEGLDVPVSWEVERDRFMRKLGVTYDDGLETR